VLTLRPYQEAGVEGVRREFAAGARAVLFVAPTGAGKTPTFGRIASGASARGNSVWIVEPSRVLLAQVSGKLHEWGIDHGVVASGFAPRPNALVQVATVQTLVKRLGKLPPPKLMIWDEAHHGVSASYVALAQALADTRILGVTASPLRLDGAGLGKGHGGCFERLVEAPSVAELTDMGFLVPARVFAPPTDIDLSGVKTRMGDYAVGEVEKRVDKAAITGSVVEHYRKLAGGKRAIAFCVSIQHAEHVAAEFRAHGVPAAHVDGEMDGAQLKRVLASFERGELSVLTNCSLISEGFDVPGVDAVILLRPTQSLALHIQQVGRALRPAEGKDFAIVVDHVGNTARHGLPDEPREWSLQGAPKRRKGDVLAEPQVRVRQCPTCYTAHRPAPVCPACGHAYQAEARQPEEREGELQEVEAAREKAERAQALRREVGAAKTREDLERIAAERGYKKGWVDHMMSARHLGARRGPGPSLFDQGYYESLNAAAERRSA
jgi:superfamily II DNA or RNA helicase